MNRRIAVLGLSGVGKSTLIDKVRETVPLLHLQASGLIKAEQAYRAQDPQSSEALRTGAVIDNQALMIAAFEREAAGTELPIIFDGHSIIDGRDDLIEIPSWVFKALRLDTICFLAADPEVIAERRRADRERERPYRDVTALRDHQEKADAAARRIATELQHPFIFIADGKIDCLLEILRS
ncbi:adenylate kinase [Sphingobium sp. AP50]|uniref:ATP-binding protein n=1 Tax=Sphingobium sp. AP50 TaxID=1884369 RepID=UPI0008B51FED|nr:AAA family ATPase [Sphingobium sp. AP50]SEK03319.1 adenylate kinase [Sphingobium sp. AP50]